MVKKAQYDNFKGWTQHSLHIKKVAGSTLTETMKEYIHNHRKDPIKFPLGQNKYAEWKALYAVADHLSSQLVVKNQSDVVPSGLYTAAGNFKKEVAEQHSCRA